MGRNDTRCAGGSVAALQPFPCGLHPSQQRNPQGATAGKIALHAELEIDLYVSDSDLHVEK